MDFGRALDALKEGARVRRTGWNGKGMWIALQGGSTVAQEHVKEGSPLAHIASERPGPVTINPHIDMRAADGTLVVGWLASQTDMLADDWEIVR